MEELLLGHEARIRDNLGISKSGFYFLEDLLMRKGGLHSTRYMSTTEQLGIYLYAVVTDLSMRNLAEPFQRSTESIQRTYHKVMKCFLNQSLYSSIIQSATSTTPTHESIEDSRTYGVFEDCIGAIDGTHIPVSPPHDERAPWRDRSGNLSQNVLAICNFDMKFTDVLVGWEGSTADSTLWVEAHRENAVHIPDGKYVLGDAGFPNCDKCLAPYRGVRYHLKEWARSSSRPQNKEELFNLRHAKLRNIIERIFGVFKNRFKILTKARPFKIQAQVRVVAALCVLHNILVNLREIEDMNEVEEEEDEEGAERGEELSGY